MKKSITAKLAFVLILISLSIGFSSCERLGGGPSDDSQNGQPVTAPDPI